MGRTFRKTDLLCLLIGITGLMVASPRQFEEVKLGIFGKRSEGHIVEVDERISTPETRNISTPDHYFLPTFEFTDVAGATHKVKSNVRYTHPMKVGDKVEIAYSAADPSQWLSTDTLNDPVSLSLYFLFLLSLLLGITGIFKHFRERVSLR